MSFGISLNDLEHVLLEVVSLTHQVLEQLEEIVSRPLTDVRLVDADDDFQEEIFGDGQYLFGQSRITEELLDDHGSDSANERICERNEDVLLQILVDL